MVKRLRLHSSLMLVLTLGLQSHISLTREPPAQSRHFKGNFNGFVTKHFIRKSILFGGCDPENFNCVSGKPELLY